MKFLGIFAILFLINGVNTSKASNTSPRLLNFNKIVTFDCIQIDDSQMVIYPSACNAADGSIKGITVTGATGTVTYKWLTSDKTPIGNTADLVNVAPGTYTLEARDQSKCLTATATYTVGQRNNIIVDESNLKIKAASCNATDGSVTGLNIGNAVQYQWFNVAGRLLMTTPDLTNAASGVCTLVLTAADGCTTTKTYIVPSTVNFPQPAKIDTIIGTCDGPAGKIALTFNPNPSDPAYNFYVFDALGNQVGVSDQSGNQGLSAVLQYGGGTPVVLTVTIAHPNSVYTFYLSNAANCKTIVGQWSLPNPVFSIVFGPYSLIRNDACGRKTGGIFDVQLSGETLKEGYPNQVWTWTDSLGNVINHVPGELGSVGKGLYTLTVQDIGGCVATQTFRILDSAGEALPPGINGATLCLPGTVTLSIINPNPKFKYKLYDSTQSTEITENDVGIFQQTVTHTTKFYATTIDGLCESDETPITVTVIAPGVIIPNTFTPNGDGINDYWDIPHIYDFPGAEIDIYNRAGQLVFHSINYSHPFNGTYNGKKLPVGVYYYVIDLKQPECFGKISGNLTIIR